MRSPKQPGGAAAPGAGRAGLDAYLRAGFTVEPGGEPAPIPLPDEPFAAWWVGRGGEARALGAYGFLRKYIPRLWFPIRAGMSRDPSYRAATLRGVPREDLPHTPGLGIERPGAVTLEVYPSFAGRIPVITVRHRPDFVALVRALAKRNEPAAIPDSQGAAMVSGLTSWARVREHRRRWHRQAPGERERATWAEEWSFLVERKELYQDRLILLSDGPYSGVPASDLGLSEDRWRELSLRIRREHECAHYFTRRAFGSMRNHLLDELIADYVGTVAALGRFRADWFLRFLGLEGTPGGRRRIEIYRGDPPLSGRDFERLGEIVRRAAGNLEAFDRSRWPEDDGTVSRRSLMVQALASLRLDEIASTAGRERIGSALSRIE